MTYRIGNKKGTGKHILLAGTHEKSLGRFIAHKLHRDGWDVWLYGRSARNQDTERWHERTCDVSSASQVKQLVDEMPRVDASIFLADSGGHGSIDELTESQLKNVLNAKIVGSILLTKELLKKAQQQRSVVKLVWSAGKRTEKPSNLIAYAAINSGLDSYISELNRHHSECCKAYYIPTTLISPSTRGDEYIEKMKKTGKDIQYAAEPPQILLDAVEKILYTDVKAGTDVIDGENIL